MLTIDVACPSCDTSFPVDPARVPAPGIHAICSTCLRAFPVYRPEGWVPDDDDATSGAREPWMPEPEVSEPGPTSTEVMEVEPVPRPVTGAASPAEVESAVEPEPELEPVAPPTPHASAPAPAGGVAGFHFNDPSARARRLARVLASDMITYNPARYDEAIAAGTLRDDFRDEIEKSWEEYVEQVGTEIAESTDFFVDALNQVLARGEQLFSGTGRPT